MMTDSKEKSINKKFLSLRIIPYKWEKFPRALEGKKGKFLFILYFLYLSCNFNK